MKYPVYLRPRIFGVKARILQGKPDILIKNRMVAEILDGLPPMIGIITFGNPRDEGITRLTKEALMLEDEPIKFMFWCIDVTTTNPMPFSERLELAKSYARASGKNVGLSVFKLVHNEAEYKEFEAQQILAGFEGVVEHDPNN